MVFASLVPCANNLPIWLFAQQWPDSEGAAVLDTVRQH
jgi:hypothetical protein